MHETGRKAKIERLTIEGKTVDSNNLTKFNLTENFCIQIEFPQVIKFIVLVILTTENVAFSSVDNRRMGSSDTWLIRTVLSNFFPFKSAASFSSNVA